MGAKLVKNFTCAICSERLTEDAARPESCPQHFFHRKCLLKSASHSNKCPIDKKEFFEVIYEGGKRVIIQHQNSEDFRENPVLQEIATQLVINNMRMIQNFTCEICETDDIESGVASPMECDHRFHKTCLLDAMKKDNHCPSCWRKVEKVMCSNGETLTIGENKLRHVLAALSAEENFKCNICDSDDTFQERALVDDCKHEFHRECIVEYARHDSTCPTCSKDIANIICLYGSVLSLSSNKPSGTTENQTSRREGEVIDSETEKETSKEAEVECMDEEGENEEDEEKRVVNENCENSNEERIEHDSEREKDLIETEHGKDQS